MEVLVDNKINIRLTKISDDAYSEHGSGLLVGQIVEGIMKEKPTIGSRFEVIKKKMYLGKDEVLPVFSTSKVTAELDANNLFKTQFSTYKLEPLD